MNEHQRLCPMTAGTRHHRPALLRLAPRALAAAALLWVSSAHALSLSPPANLAPDAFGGVVGLKETYLGPAHWIAQLPDPDRVILDRAGIEAQNARMHALDGSIHDLRSLPAQPARDWVLQQINAISASPGRTFYDESGATISAGQIKDLLANLGLNKVQASAALQYGLVTHRAALRAFPTNLRAFSSQGETDIDRFQESALFPGDAVAVLHESADGQWVFVASERYFAWMEKQYVGIGNAETVLGYGQKAPYRVVTGSTARTVYTREEPRVSALQLDMGVRVPVIADWPAMKQVNGQQAHAGHVVELPVRNADGSLSLVPALLPRSQDTAADYLPLTPRNLLTQAFKFLGERYGWGHSYDARDCSGFVSEIYRSMGVLLPRNTSAQAISPALDRVPLADASDAARQQAVANLEVGDLIYIPGHVMMSIGKVGDTHWLIHDTNGGSWLGADGTRVKAALNGVSVTPYQPMMASDTASYVDRTTNIQRIRPFTKK
jgi:cell wall-associated NlpC family hydrolase